MWRERRLPPLLRLREACELFPVIPLFASAVGQKAQLFRLQKTVKCSVL